MFCIFFSRGLEPLTNFVMMVSYNYWYKHNSISQQGKFTFVEQGSQTNATLLFPPDDEKSLKTSFDGNQTSVIIIQLHETLCNIV